MQQKYGDDEGKKALCALGSHLLHFEDKVGHFSPTAHTPSLFSYNLAASHCPIYQEEPQKNLRND